jgi:hypothetical protein
VAHLTDGVLRRMVDDPDAKACADGAHLEGCAECKARFEAIAGDAKSIATLLAVPDVRVDVRRAYDRVMAAPKAQAGLGFRLPTWLPAFGPVRLALVAAVALFAVVGFAFAASGLFAQPTKVQAVPITLNDIQALSQLGEYGTLTWTTQPDLRVTPDAAEATQVSGGITTPKVAKLPAGVSSTVTYAGMSKAVATFTFSAAKAAASAKAHGTTLPKMPAGMDGATLTITIGPAVAEVFGNLKKPEASTTASQLDLPQLIVAKSASPTVTSTQVTVSDLESYIVAQPGISPELKKTIKAIGDPTTTLFIPVPVEFGTAKSVKVQGVDGVALGDNTGVGSGVVWIKDGHVWAVAGSIKQSDAIQIANNLS